MALSSSSSSFSSTVVAVGAIIPSQADLSPAVDVINFRLSDIIAGDTFPTLVWTIQLTIGRLVSWSVPCVCTEDQQALILRAKERSSEQQRLESFDMPASVHPMSMLLGTVCVMFSVWSVVYEFIMLMSNNPNKSCIFHCRDHHFTTRWQLIIITITN